MATSFKAKLVQALLKKCLLCKHLWEIVSVKILHLRGLRNLRFITRVGLPLR
jgi:hypothetical protein